MIKSYKLRPKTLEILDWRIVGGNLYYKILENRFPLAIYDVYKMNPYISGNNKFNSDCRFADKVFSENVVNEILYRENHRLLEEYISGEDEHLLKRGMCILYNKLKLNANL